MPRRKKSADGDAIAGNAVHEAEKPAPKPKEKAKPPAAVIADAEKNGETVQKEPAGKETQAAPPVPAPPEKPSEPEKKPQPAPTFGAGVRSRRG